MGSLHNITAPVAKATAAAPTITEGDVAGLSQDLSGNLRVAATIGSVSVSGDATATAAAPSYSEGTPNPISQNLTGDQRVIAKIAAAQTLGLVAGSSVIGKVGIDQTTPGTTNAVELGPYSYSRKTADGQVKATAGFIHTVTISPTGTVTAGVMTIYDNAAETGTVVLSISLPITTFTPFSVTLDVSTANGIFVGFDATLANVQVTVSYR